MSLVIGLTGGIGSGKSAAADEFLRLGASVVDTDAIAHELTAGDGAAIAQIRAQFGSEFIAPTGALDRARMRRRVFVDPAARKTLEALLHPMIRRESAKRIEAASGPYVVHVVPLLIESGNYRQRVDRVLVVDCPEELQVARASARSRLSEEEVRAVLATQASRSERLAAADDVIDNAGTVEALHQQVAMLHARYSELAENAER